MKEDAIEITYVLLTVAATPYRCTDVVVGRVVGGTTNRNPYVPRFRPEFGTADEGERWIRGHHAPDSDAAQALLATWLLLHGSAG